MFWCPMYKFLEDSNVKESGILDHYCKDKLTLDNIDAIADVTSDNTRDY